MQAVSEESRRSIESILSDYEKKHPSVEIQFEVGAAGGPFQEKLTIEVASGTVPDVIWGWNNVLKSVQPTQTTLAQTQERMMANWTQAGMK